MLSGQLSKEVARTTIKPTVRGTFTARDLRDRHRSGSPMIISAAKSNEAEYQPPDGPSSVNLTILPTARN